VPIKRGWQKLKAGFIHLLHLDDSAHRIALGVAVGLFIAITPTWGIQMLLVVGLAWLVRANKVAGVPMVWLTNPATNVPIYSFCYVVGQALVGGPGLEEVKHAFVPHVDPALGLWDKTVAVFHQWLALMWHAAVPLWVGCVVVGLAAGAISYGVMYYTITYYRRHHHPHRAPDAATPP
jgi:hypothetical protein